MSEYYAVSDSTLRILKNFAQIGDSVLLREGVTQKTMTPSKSVLAIAELDKAWLQDTAVYQLHDLLSNLTAYDKPTLIFTEKQFVIKGTNSPSHVEYPYSDPSVINTPPEKAFPLENPRAVFTLSAVAIAEIKKMAAINNLPTISIDIDPNGKTIVVKPQDEKNPGSRTYSYPVHTDPKQITTLTGDGKFSAWIKREFFELLMDGAYTITVGDWPYIFVQHQTEPISYYIVRQMNKK